MATLIVNDNSAGLPVILLVDDHEDILLFLTTLLKDKYKILTAYDGQEACEILENNWVSLVVSDVMMPEMDGFELCEWMKSNEDLIHIPLILLTAKDTIQSKIQGLKIGADAYIEKPFSSEHLQIQIDNLLRGRVQLKDFYANSPLARVNHGSHVKGNEQFLEEIKQLILDHLDDPDLDVVRLAEMLHMSRPTLYRKIKSLFNLSPNEMIHLIRLTKAAEMIAQDQLRISEVAERVGYKSVGQFGRNFSKQFKMTPSEYMEKVRRAL